MATRPPARTVLEEPPPGVASDPKALKDWMKLREQVQLQRQREALPAGRPVSDLPIRQMSADEAANTREGRDLADIPSTAPIVLGMHHLV